MTDRSSRKTVADPFAEVITRRHDTAVILHMYYTEMWEEIADYFANLEQDFDLFVSIPGEAEFSEGKILGKHEHSYIYRCPNRGRDVAPFLKILSAIYPFNYKYVLKIHTKRSPHRQDGDIWRRDVYGKLAGSVKLVHDIKQVLDSKANIGIFAPQGHVLPSAFNWEPNSEKVKKLARLTGIPYESQEFQFIACTMFWVRPSAFQSIINLPISASDFELEQGQTDGTMAHAFERLFGLLIQSQGLHIVEFSEIGGQKNLVIDEKDQLIAWYESEKVKRDRFITERDMAFADCRGRIALLEKELAGVYESKSWKLTYPLRWISARLKGLND